MYLYFQQEENNNISTNNQLQNYYQQNQLALPNNGQQRLQQLLRSGTSAINHAVANNINNGRYNIASANPLLAEKLAATSSGIKQEPMNSEYTSMNYGSASPMQRVPSGKPQVHDAGGGKGKSLRFKIHVISLYIIYYLNLQLVYKACSIIFKCIRYDKNIVTLMINFS